MKDQIRQLIARGDTKKALELFAEKNDDGLLLLNKFSNLEKQRLMGLIDFGSHTQELSKINYALLQILSEPKPEIPPAPNTLRPAPKQAGKKSVFISYAHEDKDLQKRLRAHLATLRRSNKISDWSDEEIIPGEEWNEAIIGKLRSADIILLLISTDFINSDFIWDNELPIAMERHERGEAIVVPVILQPCLWTDLEIGALQALPAGGRPVTDWSNQDQAFLSVAEGLRRLLG